MIQLNPKQKQAAEFVSGIAAVVAVPGSGKTLTMTTRIGNLVLRHGVAPESILGLTFTRNAAQAMREKLKPILEDRASRVTLSTIHAFCHNLLRQEGRIFEVLHGKEQMILLRKIMSKAKVKNLPTGMILREISLAKSNLVSVEEFGALYEGDETMQSIAKVYAAYDLEKQKKGILDFDDLLTETYRLLESDIDVLEKHRSSYKHVLVDEFQDTNPAQMAILRQLVGKKNGGSFWVCGDDWQSIYAFTGASVGNILNFDKAFPKASRYVLNTNYRSTPQILQACQTLINHNIRKIDKALATNNKAGDGVIVLTSVNEENEATQVVNEIRDLVDQRNYALKDIAVLYRANFQSRAIEEAFSQNKIPYHIEKGHNFFQRFEVKVLLDYLRLIKDPDSEEGDEALRQVLNVPNRYIGRKFMADLEEHSGKKGVRMYEGLTTMRVSPPYLRKNVAEFLDIVDPLVGSKLEPHEILMMLRESLDYDQFIAEDDVPSPDDSKLANVNQLQLVASRYQDIGSLLNYADTFKDELTNDKDGVALMTIHKSKGLEFPAVFVIGMVEGILPNRNGDIEEERRIAFVSMSRAMRQLYLSWSQHSSGRPVKRSSFIEEALGE
ncbi:ATP-dependent helicase [Desulfatibacillum aliphaticivorans]|uniref:ATP-dependent helicase n=1 Tax=Desulfatibacillum aliphaticivorans TaxID=218208 RepID=UPI0004263E24|nr:ATP-dependent helicase [Desulfatibacillum aliphaticivorans]